jgi:hypothetical protein
MKTRAKIILKTLTDLTGAVRSLAADGSHHRNELTQPGSVGLPPHAPARTAAGGLPGFMLTWSELGAARKLAAWRRGGINE